MIWREKLEVRRRRGRRFGCLLEQNLLRRKGVERDGGEGEEEEGRGMGRKGRRREGIREKKERKGRGRDREERGG